MRFIAEASFPGEPFHTYVRTGVAGERIGEVQASIRPEVAPHVTEPLMLAFDASVHNRIATSPEDLLSAGLERYASGVMGGA